MFLDGVLKRTEVKLGARPSSSLCEDFVSSMGSCRKRRDHNTVDGARFFRFYRSVHVRQSLLSEDNDHSR